MSRASVLYWPNLATSRCALAPWYPDLKFRQLSSTMLSMDHNDKAAVVNPAGRGGLVNATISQIPKPTLRGELGVGLGGRLAGRGVEAGFRNWAEGYIDKTPLFLIVLLMQPYENGNSVMNDHAKLILLPKP